MIFNTELAKMIDECDRNSIDWDAVGKKVDELFPGCYFEGLSVAWIEKRDKFMIIDDDGEKIVFTPVRLNDKDWMTAAGQRGATREVSSE